MENWYPDMLKVPAGGTQGTLDALTSFYDADADIHFAELGIYQASTAEFVLKTFPNARVYLFDFDKTVQAARQRFQDFAPRVHCFGNSNRHLDSYNWNLMKLYVENGHAPLFDYIFLDGAHTFAIDALSFFLGDRLLKPGGYFDFDDYNWRLRGSSLDPEKVPVIKEQYTDEQIDDRQVKTLVDHYVKTDPGYTEVIKNKVYRKA
ncbi:MAG: class I SAM-dependent methyltransferase [Pseudomonadota bacterium]